MEEWGRNGGGEEGGKSSGQAEAGRGGHGERLTGESTAAGGSGG